jgi:hypothetical protein
MVLLHNVAAHNKNFTGRESYLTLFYTRGLGTVVSQVMVPQPYRFFPLIFLHRYGNLTLLKFSFKWVKVMLPYTEEGGLPVVGGGGRLMPHSAGSVTTQSIALKYVMASEPYRYTHLIFKTGHGRFAIH